MWPYSKRAPYYPYPLGGAVTPGNVAPPNAAGVPFAGPMPYGSSTTSAPISNVAVETAFSLSAAIEAGVLAVQGSCMNFEASGFFNTTGTPTIIMRARLDNGTTGDILAQSPTTTLANNANTNPWIFRGRINVRLVPSLWGSGVSEFMHATGVGPSAGAIALGGGSVALAIDSRVAHTLFLSATFSVANPNNAIVMTQFQVYAFNPRATS